MIGQSSVSLCVEELTNTSKDKYLSLVRYTLSLITDSLLTFEDERLVYVSSKSFRLGHPNGN